MGSSPGVSDWVQPDVPAFAVVGRVNMGKSSVLATLLEIDDNELLRVSAMPGETTNCQTHRVVFSDRECVRFIDTPGFSQPVEAMRAIQKIHGEGTPGLDAIREFMAEAGPEFGDEKRLLEPLVEGAGVLYVVDPAKPLRDDFLAEMEILRWTGRPRLAVMNRREGSKGPDEEEWRSRLGGSFNLTRTFDAHHARYDERLRLLRSLLEIEEHHREALEETIRLVEREWDTRREEAAEAVLGFLESALSLRMSATLDERDLALESRRQRQPGEAGEGVFREAGEAGAELRRRVAQDLPAPFAEGGRESGELSGDRSREFRDVEQVGVEPRAADACGIGDGSGGGRAGGCGDGIPEPRGGRGAGGDHGRGGGVVQGREPAGSEGGFQRRPGRFQAGDRRGQGAFGRTAAQSEFPVGVAGRHSDALPADAGAAHGRRDEERLESGGSGFTRGFPTERRKILGKWFASCLKGKPDRDLEPKVFGELVETLDEVAG